MVKAYIINDLETLRQERFRQEPATVPLPMPAPIPLELPEQPDPYDSTEKFQNSRVIVIDLG